MNNKSADFFKARIGQAVLETTLLHFGYQVERLGCQIRPAFDNNAERAREYPPDLLITVPETGQTTYLEIKLQPEHPLWVKIPKEQVSLLQHDYPNTLLVFVSAYNGSINCLDINDSSISDDKLDKDGNYRLALFAEEWKPLWEFFPKIQKGEKTDELWTVLKAVIDDFAGNRLISGKTSGFFAEEQDALKRYIEKHWHPGMLDQDIHNMNIETAAVDELWEQAMAIHSFRFAFDLCGGEANIDHPAFNQVMDKLRNRIEENTVTIPYQTIKKTLTEYPDLYKQLQALEEEVQNSSPYDSAVILLEGLLRIIPSGIGKTCVRPEFDEKSEPIEVDFKTLLTLIRRRNCLYD